MNRCPITYELCTGKYSAKGLKLLSRNLDHLNDFPYTSKEQIQLAQEYATKLSIQGVQPKLSAVLNVKQALFEVVEKKGQFILKPPHLIYNELPQNEDVTMKLAKIAGIETPFHGMIYSSDQNLTYFIKRFDRTSKGKRVALEDFSQLLEHTRDLKYDSSMENTVKIVDQLCSFPSVEKIKLFRLALFNFLVGNEDMHLKNLSLVTQEDLVQLSPAYDLVNSKIVTKGKEEIALPLSGKKRNLKKEHFFEYFAKERLGLNDLIIEQEIRRFKEALPLWDEMLSICFLSDEMKSKYKALVKERTSRLGLDS